MAVDEVEEFVALALTLLVHVLGAGLLIWGMLDRGPGDGRGGRPPRGDGPGGRGPDGGPAEPAGPPPGGGRSPLPLPTTQPSRLRMRERGRIAERCPGPGRRPAHDPRPRRAPERR